MGDFSSDWIDLSRGIGREDPSLRKSNDVLYPENRYYGPEAGSRLGELYRVAKMAYVWPIGVTVPWIGGCVGFLTDSE